MFQVPKAHHLIFEGAELTGKSYLMSQIYDFLESKYNQHGHVLDGCHWLNTDIGIYGTPLGKPCIAAFVEIVKVLRAKNVLLEKFHISDIVYNRLHNRRNISYNDIERKLQKLNAKIVFCTIRENTSIIQKRINDRFKLYPHYRRIAQKPEWYIKQQREYRRHIQKTTLPCLEVDVSRLPNHKAVSDILCWIREQ